MPKIPHKIYLISIIAAIVLLASITASPLIAKIKKHLDRPSNIVRNDPTLEGSPKPIQVDGSTKYHYAQDYTIVLVGDSMTERLGNTDELRAYLKRYYPNKTIRILNYGYGSTNVLSLPDRFDKETTASGRLFTPINQLDYDLIMIESMGNNPLSEYPLDQGLIKQNQILDQVIANIHQVSPRAKIAFVATIAPNKQKFGEGAVDLSPAKRLEWANERIAYIQNHIAYAKAHNIPLVDIYHDSLDQNGDGNLEYLNSADYIHPSPDGVFFISQEIADYIAKNQLLPQ